MAKRAHLSVNDLLQQWDDSDEDCDDDFDNVDEPIMEGSDDEFSDLDENDSDDEIDGGDPNSMQGSPASPSVLMQTFLQTLLGTNNHGQADFHPAVYLTSRTNTGHLLVTTESLRLTFLT